MSFICRCSHPRVGVTHRNPTYPCWSWLQIYICTFSLPSLHCCRCFGMALIHNTPVSSWTAPALVLVAEVACDVKQDVIPGDCALLSAGWRGGEGLSLVYAHLSPVWQVAIQLQFWSSLQTVSFFLIMVEIRHHCKQEPQKKCDKTDSCEKVTSVSVLKKFDLALFSSGFHGQCDKCRTPQGGHAGGRAKFLWRLELRKEWCADQPFSCFQQSK